MSAISFTRDDASGCRAGSPDPAALPGEAEYGDPARRRRAAPFPEPRAKITPVARGLLGLIWLSNT